ncbi:MAG: NPCBM/NEW2 domain-containing protein [Puniceicoccales bacterium]|jgi:hypothetical protein|nr:NPCBM/NEW2 domain-containing protein [Puniceicoccales bacterium]
MKTFPVPSVGFFGFALAVLFAAPVVLGAGGTGGTGGVVAAPASAAPASAKSAPVPAFATVETGVVRVSTPAQKLSVALNGARDLYLVATTGGDSYDYDQALWGDPVLVTAGGERVPLSSLKPASARTGWGGLLVDHALGGGDLRVGQRRFARGFWAHAPSQLHFKLDGKTYVRFESFVGLSPSAKNGTVVFQVRAVPADLSAQFAKSGGGGASGRTAAPAPKVASAGATKFAFNAEAAARLRAAGVNELLFIRRLTFTANHVYTDFINSRWLPGGGICALDLRTGTVREIAPEFTKTGVVGWFDLSFDAKKIVFDFKAGPNEGYRIYEVGVDGSGLRQITFPPENEAALIAKYRRGYHHGTDDMDPCYLPDGGIAFTSTRCQFSVLCDSGDGFTVKNLHRVNADGSGLRALSYSPLSEANPVLMPDGRILYHRWEYVDKAAGNCKALWAMNPDGSGSAEVYGNTISFPETKIQARPIPGAPGRVVMLGASHWINNALGTIIVVDTSKNIRSADSMRYVTGDVAAFAHDGFHFKDADGKWFYNRDGKPGRLFRNPWPVSENLFIAARKPAGPAWSDPTAYGLALVDGTGADTPLLTDPGCSLWLPVALATRPRPPQATGAALDDDLAAKGLARCIVTDIYTGLEGVPRGTVKHLRILEQVPRPWAARRDGNTAGMAHSAVGDGFLSVKVQHGVVPVEDDGSAHFLVPAGRAIYFQALDADYRALQTERTYVNYLPGETRSCIGCHETPDIVPSRFTAGGNPKALRRPASTPAPQRGQRDAALVFDYERQIQPIWNRRCAECHTGAKPEAGLNLAATPAGVYNTSYNSLTRAARRAGELLGQHRRYRNEDAASNGIEYLAPMSTGAISSPLSAFLHGRSTVGSGLKSVDSGQWTVASERGAASSTSKPLTTDHRPLTTSPTPPLAYRVSPPAGNAAERARTDANALAARLVKAHAGTVKLTPEELLLVDNWLDINCQFHPSYWGAKNVRFATQPDYRRPVTFEQARSTTPPPPAALGAAGL